MRDRAWCEKAREDMFLRSDIDDRALSSSMPFARQPICSANALAKTLYV